MAGEQTIKFAIFIPKARTHAYRLREREPVIITTSIVCLSEQRLLADDASQSDC